MKIPRMLCSASFKKRLKSLRKNWKKVRFPLPQSVSLYGSAASVCRCLVCPAAFQEVSPGQGCGFACEVALGTRGSAGLWAEPGLPGPGWRAGGLWAGLRRVGIKMRSNERSNLFTVERGGMLFFFFGRKMNQIWELELGLILNNV